MYYIDGPRHIFYIFLPFLPLKNWITSSAIISNWLLITLPFGRNITPGLMQMFQDGYKNKLLYVGCFFLLFFHITISPFLHPRFAEPFHRFIIQICPFKWFSPTLYICTIKPLHYLTVEPILKISKLILMPCS